MLTAVVARRLSSHLQSKTLEVVGSILTGCWAFFFSFYPSVGFLNQVPQGGADFPLQKMDA